MCGPKRDGDPDKASQGRRFKKSGHSGGALLIGSAGGDFSLLFSFFCEGLPDGAAAPLWS